MFKEHGYRNDSKGWKLGVVMLGTAFVLPLAGGCCLAQEAAPETETEAKSDRRTATIQVVSITGNELTYYELETEATEGVREAGAEDESEAMTTKGKSKAPAFTPRDGNMPDFVSGDGSVPSFTPGDGNMPDFGSGNGSAPNFPPGDGSMPDFGTGNNRGGRNIKTVYLPVAVPVITNTGETMNFQILQAGDTLEVVFLQDQSGNEVITEMTLIRVSEAAE